MKHNKFVTEIFKGTIDVPADTVEKYRQWADFERTLDPLGRSESTTINGWQYSFNNNQSPPNWLNSMFSGIQKIKDEIGYNAVKSIWTVDYEKGGFQDPHFHQPGNRLFTVIINISGTGELLLFDPRQIATAQGESIIEIETLNPGDWIAMPSWLTHSTRPCKDNRIILVMDVHQ